MSVQSEEPKHFQGGGGGGGGVEGNRVGSVHHQLTRQEISDMDIINKQMMDDTFDYSPTPEIEPISNLDKVQFPTYPNVHSFDLQSLSNRYPNTFDVQWKRGIGSGHTITFRRASLPPGFRAYITINRKYLFIMYESIVVYWFQLLNNTKKVEMDVGVHQRKKNMVPERLRRLLDLKMSGQDATNFQQRVRRYRSIKNQQDQTHLLKELINILQRRNAPKENPIQPVTAYRV